MEVQPAAKPKTPTKKVDEKINRFICFPKKR